MVYAMISPTPYPVIRSTFRRACLLSAMSSVGGQLLKEGDRTMTGAIQKSLEEICKRYNVDIEGVDFNESIEISSEPQSKANCMYHS